MHDLQKTIFIIFVKTIAFQCWIREVARMGYFSSWKIRHPTKDLLLCFQCSKNAPPPMELYNVPLRVPRYQLQKQVSDFPENSAFISQPDCLKYFIFCKMINFYEILESWSLFHHYIYFSIKYKMYQILTFMIYMFIRNYELKMLIIS